jgi:subtilisin family serine protease
MKKVDCRLRALARRDQMGGLIAESELAAGPEPLVEVLMRCDGTPTRSQLENLGLRVRSMLPGPETVVSVEGAAETITALEGPHHPWIRRVEASRPLISELDISCVDVGAIAVQANLPPIKGAGVLVGIVDGGIDFTHPNFRAADGSSRILCLWDQNAPSAPGAALPAGREYTKAELDAALAAVDPFSLIDHRDRLAHGTHVAGIAAGSEATSGGTRSGVAPEADLEWGRGACSAC